MKKNLQIGTRLSSLALLLIIFFICCDSYAYDGFRQINRGELEGISDEYEVDFQLLEKDGSLDHLIIYVKDYDIDLDGSPELLVTIGHSSYCGTGGCLVDIYKKCGVKWCKQELGLPSLWHLVPKRTGVITNGMPDYVFEYNLWQFDGESYQWKRKVLSNEFEAVERNKEYLPQMKFYKDD